MARQEMKWIVDEDNTAWDTEADALSHEEVLAFNRATSAVAEAGKPISDPARDALCAQLQSGLHGIKLVLLDKKK